MRVVFLYFSGKDKGKPLMQGRYGAFLSKLMRSNMIKKVITNEQEKNKKKGKTVKEQQIIKKDIENCYEYSCYQTNRFFANFGLFVKNKVNKDVLKKNKNTLKKQKTINNDNFIILLFMAINAAVSPFSIPTCSTRTQTPIPK